MRLVSLTCSNTEIVWALGCQKQLVGVDSHSDFPLLREYLKIPIMGCQPEAEPGV